MIFSNTSQARCATPSKVHGKDGQCGVRRHRDLNRALALFPVQHLDPPAQRALEVLRQHLTELMG